MCKEAVVLYVQSQYFFLETLSKTMKSPRQNSPSPGLVLKPIPTKYKAYLQTNK